MHSVLSCATRALARATPVRQTLGAKSFAAPRAAALRPVARAVAPRGRFFAAAADQVRRLPPLRVATDGIVVGCVVSDRARPRDDSPSRRFALGVEKYRERRRRFALRIRGTPEPRTRR